jgi:hypothetical protein
VYCGCLFLRGNWSWVSSNWIYFEMMIDLQICEFILNSLYLPSVTVGNLLRISSAKLEKKVVLRRFLVVT